MRRITIGVSIDKMFNAKDAAKTGVSIRTPELRPLNVVFIFGYILLISAFLAHAPYAFVNVR